MIRTTGPTQAPAPSPPAQGGSTPTPPTPPPPSTPADQTILGRTIVKAAAIGFGIAGAVVHGAAGGAAGLAHGAGLQGLAADRTFFGTFAANLAVSGAVSATLGHLGPMGYATTMAFNLISGVLSWGGESQSTQDMVKKTAADWTDNVTKQIPSFSKKDAEPSVARRVINGAIGELVGVAAGTSVGASEWYGAGKEWGTKAYNNLAATADKLRGQ